MPDIKSNLSPRLLAQIKRLDLRARLVVEGFLTGLHKSPYHGFSVEFAEYRPYLPGDEVKRIDWKVLARSDKYFVKEFEEETNLKAYILLDSSASMGYHSRNVVNKLEYGSSLAAALSFLLLSQNDAAGLALFNSRLQKYLPPRSRRTHWHAILQELNQARPQGQTSYKRIFLELAGHLKRRGLLVLISDLWGDDGEIINSLKNFRHLKHEVLVFHLLDPDEASFPFKSEAVFADMETGQELQLSPSDIRQKYLAALKQRTDYLGRECRRHLIDYQPLVTDQPFDQALLKYLHKRQKLG
ncbi:DUF58 domain-containing protein [candidate division TA06 bacterium]|uniref:DUF58 domain-containing protein n=1 Tax=candidate division TA06 bacterium TaxID=2250710 RepID=A0A933ML37_UNCT6|nr:DUF58 domain-containing protein [candidate division TA06 bacterium]